MLSPENHHPIVMKILTSVWIYRYLKISMEKTKGKISVQIDEPTNLFLMNIYVYDISYANIHELYRKEVFA